MNLTFAGTNWFVPATAILALAVVVLLLGYLPAAQVRIRWLCAALKFVGIAALVFCLLEPLRTSQRVRPGANLMAVVADNSQSLRIKDEGQTRSRGEALRELLRPQKDGWQSRLSEDFELRQHVFDTRLQNATDFQELNFEGRSSAIGSTLRALADRFRGRPLAGILLFTDGNATDLGGTPLDIEGLPPLYPVVLGRGSSTRDIAIAQVGVSQSAFEDAPVAIQAELSTAGYQGQRLAAQLRDQSGRIVKNETVTGRAANETVPVRLQIKPEKPGVTFYELNVGTRERLSGTRPTTVVPASPPPPASANATTTASSAASPAATVDPDTDTRGDEATLANNHRVIAVDRGGGPYRILYVSGRPNWEYKFLNRALEEDHQIQLVGLIRIAKREPKFEFRGRAGETSNPLFRGFGNQNPDEVERYDQPVIVRLNTRDATELPHGFPRAAEELFGYHAVILDDLEAAFFTTEQAMLLQRFVSERGGGLLMLGGMESFREGEYYRTPIGEMLPVYLDREPATEAPTSPAVKLSLAREGWLQPWARLREHESTERERLEAMPPFLVANRVRDVKPGASIIASAKDEAGHDLPALVVQRFGRGRTAALTLGDIWRWGMQDANAHADMEKFWRQTARWLVSEVPGRVDLTVEPIPNDPNGSMRLEVRVRDAAFQPVDNANVQIHVEPITFGPAVGAPASATTPAPASGANASASTNNAGAPASGLTHLRAEPGSTEPGLYVTTYLPRLTGGFRATACVTNEVGADIGRDEAGWSSDPAAEEFKSLVPNLGLLESLAKRTGGELVTPETLPDLVKRLPTRHAPVMEAWTFPIWHHAALFAFALACLAAEWGLRRWKGLP